MAHYLTTVRSAIVSAVTGLTTTGANVFEDEPYPLQATQVPALVISAWSPSVGFAAMDASVIQVDVDVGIECIAKGTSGLQTTLDTIAKEVQVALAAVTSIGSRAVQIAPVAVERPQFILDTDQPVARRLLLYRIAPLFTSSADPTSLS